MLRSVAELYGSSVETVDGAVGHLADVYVDDRRWKVRHLVVETGHGLGGRQVLVAPRSVSSADPARRRLRTGLTTRQIAGGPDAATARPVSRQHQLELSDCYHFPSYAVTAGASVLLAAPVEAGATDDPHLRSVRAITGYFVHARDGDAGHVADFLVEAESWSLRHLVVGVGIWRALRRTLVPVGWITGVSWTARALDVSLPAEAIRLAPAYDRGSGLSPEHEARVLGYYGPPPPAP
ncbi:MAG TPA: PRC-barrel domain-containing protein [Methylomirabilota bacterium]|nr:PRC-barrel domain-containing protein [Methylomirabilota bacterium]